DFNIRIQIDAAFPVERVQPNVIRQPRPQLLLVGRARIAVRLKWAIRFVPLLHLIIGQHTPPTRHTSLQESAAPAMPEPTVMDFSWNHSARAPVAITDISARMRAGRSIIRRRGCSLCCDCQAKSFEVRSRKTGSTSR